jgi:hypothetical protein
MDNRDEVRLRHMLDAAKKDLLPSPQFRFQTKREALSVLTTLQHRFKGADAG